MRQVLRFQQMAVAIVIITAATTAADDPPSMAKLTVKLRGALKQEATSRDTPEHAGAVMALCDMYVALRSDSRHGNSDTMKGLAARCRRRLIDVCDLIRVHLKRDGIERPENLDKKLRAIDQWIRDQSKQEDSTLGYSDAQLQKITGRFAPGGIPDHGWMLVELISRTISPDFWASQGGPGVVVYYPLQRAMVVRATTRVHEDVQALLQALGGLPR